MATFVLVHGAWHGGWCWGPLELALRGGGHDVTSPTLTGLGERSHEATAQAGPSTSLHAMHHAQAQKSPCRSPLMKHFVGEYQQLAQYETSEFTIRRFQAAR